MLIKTRFFAAASLLALITWVIGPNNSTANLRQEWTVYNVPYVSQVPTGEWNDPRQIDGCEEAVMAMAIAWARGGADIPAEEARRGCHQYFRI